LLFSGFTVLSFEEEEEDFIIRSVTASYSFMGGGEDFIRSMTALYTFSVVSKLPSVAELDIHTLGFCGGGFVWSRKTGASNMLAVILRGSNSSSW